MQSLVFPPVKPPTDGLLTARAAASVAMGMVIGAGLFIALSGLALIILRRRLNPADIPAFVH